MQEFNVYPISTAFCTNADTDLVDIVTAPSADVYSTSYV